MTRTKAGRPAKRLLPNVGEDDRGLDQGEKGSDSRHIAKIQPTGPIGLEYERKESEESEDHLGFVA